MLYLAVTFTILQSVLMNIPMLWTSVVDDLGRCNAFSLWSNPVDNQIYSITVAAWLYIILLAILLYCYERIVRKLNKQTSTVTPGTITTTTNQPDSNTNNQESSTNRSQVGVIKTMIIISVTYAITSFLKYIGYIAWSFDNGSVLGQIPQYWVNVALYFLNAWLDPFIYVLSHRDMRRQFLNYIFCKCLKGGGIGNNSC